MRAARRRLDSADDAEDVAQDAFVRLLDHEPRNSRAWLFTVTDRLAIDRHRAAVRRERVATRAPVHLVADESADTDLARDERIATVQGVLRSLGARDRQLLLLHHAGLPYREIAAQLDVSPSSVGSLLTRAHRRFLSHYHAQHGTHPEASTNATNA